MQHTSWFIQLVVCGAILLSLGGTSFAQDNQGKQSGDQQQDKKGQDLLQKAMESKLSAQTLTELGDVIKLCEDALKAGLNEDDTSFCTSLLSSTLLERARGISARILSSSPTSQEELQQIVQLRQIAVADLERAIELDDKSAESHYRLGRLYAMSQQDLEKSRAEFDKALKLEFDDAAMHAEALIGHAAVTDDPVTKQKDYDAAVALLPDNSQVLQLRSQFHLDQGDYDKALADADEAVKQDPDQAGPHELRGRALVNLDRLEEAREAYDKAIEISPMAPLPLLQRANINIMLQQGAKALDDLNRTISLVGPQPQLLALRATAYLQAEQKEKAMADIEQAMNQLDEPDQGDAITMLRLGFVLASAQEHRQAIEVYNKVLQAEANNAPAIEARGDAYLNIGEHATAIEDYNKALALDPDSDHVLNNLAWVLATSPDDAVRNGKRAIELATKAAELTEFKESHILSTLAAAYAETGDFDKAKEWSTKAVAISEAEQGSTLEQLKGELESYKQGKPWRERQQEDNSDK